MDVDGPPRDLVGYGRHVPRVVWPEGARLAINIVVNYEEGSEYSHPGGDNRNERAGELPSTVAADVRDLNVESVFEYGSRAGVWRLLRLLDEFGIRATFFASALALKENPAVASAIRDGGHEAAGHGLRWSEPWLVDRDEERRRLRLAVSVIEELCGERPRGWYSRYGPSVHTRELLVEEGGFLYDSDAYNDDLPYFVEVDDRRHLVVPYTQVYNDMRYARQAFTSPTDFFETCRAGFDVLWDEGATHPRMMSIGLHPRLAGQPPRAFALKQFVEYAIEKGDVWFARRIDIAEHWSAHHDDFDA